MATLQIDTHTAECVLTPRGQLSRAAACDLRSTLHKHLVECVDVLVDIGSLTIAAPEALHAFPAALADAGGWPFARLVLFGASAQAAGVLRAEGVASTVPVARDLAAARLLLNTRPDRITRRVELPEDPSAAAHARSTVGAACTDWGVTGRFPDARLVATELVTNAVTHARAASVLIIGLDRYGLHVAVRDGSTAGVRAIRAGGGRPGRGRGLHLVAELTRAWGVAAHPDGKTVWAVLPPR